MKFARVSRGASSKAVRSSLLLALVPISGSSSGLVTSILVARLYGAEGRGEYAILIALTMTIAQITSMGLGEALAVHLVRYGGPSRPRAWIATLWMTILTISGLIAILFPHHWTLLVGIGVASGFLQGSSFLLVFGAERRWVLAQLIQPLSVLGAASAAGFFDLSVGVVLGVYAISPAFAMLVCLPRIPRTGSGTAGNRTIAIQLLTMGFHRQINVTALAVLRRFDVIALGIFATTLDVGKYAIAMSLIDQALLVPWLLSGRIIRAGLSDSSPSLRNTLRNTLALMAIPILIVAAVGWWAIPLVWGPEFETSYWYFLCAVPGALACGAARALSSLHMARDSQGEVAKITVWLFPLLLAFIGIGAAMFGPYGVAATWGLGYILLATVSLRIALRGERRTGLAAKPS